MLSDWHNPCGGTPWRTLSDGQIEVQGRGVLYAEGTGPWSLRTYADNSWRNFRPEILAAASRRSVPPSWLVALLVCESGINSGSRQKQAATRNSCCWGPMAVMVTPHANYRIGGYTSPDEMLDPGKGIDAGAAIVAQKRQLGMDLPAIAAAYNCGHPCNPLAPETAPPGLAVRNAFGLCSASIAGMSYPEVAIRVNNTAIAELGVPSGSRPIWPWLLFGAGVVTLGYSWMRA